MQTLFYYSNLILVCVVILYSVFILAHIFSWLLIKKQGLANRENDTKVSVIIPARNEENNIGMCLEALLAQDYPPDMMEIIVCDDHSEDNTAKEASKILNNAKCNYKYLKAEANLFGKKDAIEAGIKASTGELIIQTDADCTFGKDWLSAMANNYKKNKAVMLCGPVATANEKNFCEKFQGLEMCGLSVLSGAGIGLGIPLLSNAANIAYTRKAFDAVNGFEGARYTPSGDDILLMFKLNNKFKGGISYVKNPEAIVYTNAQPTWKDLLNQRIRWASKGFNSGSLLNSIVSFLVFLSNFLILIGLISLFIYPQFTNRVIASLLLKALIDFLLLSCGVNFFRKGNLVAYFPLSSLIVMLYTSFIGIAASFSSYSWKGRNY